MAETHLQIAILTTGGTIAMRHDAAAGGAIPTLGAADFTAVLPYLSRRHKWRIKWRNKR